MATVYWVVARGGEIEPSHLRGKRRIPVFQKRTHAGVCCSGAGGLPSEALIGERITVRILCKIRGPVVQGRVDAREFRAASPLPLSGCDPVGLLWGTMWEELSITCWHRRALIIRRG